jgi:hypothetical protein
MDENKWGKLTNSEHSNDFVFDTRVWKGTFDLIDDPKPVHVGLVQGYRLHDWNDINADDEYYVPGGPGICFLVEFETAGGKPYTAQIVVPKDELIKALALLVE